MIVMFFLNISFRIFLFFSKIDNVFEWLVLSINSIILEFYVLVDWVSCLFIGFILVISSIVLIYRMDYIKGDRGINRFFYLVLLFVFSIVLIILRPRMVRIIFGWDILGLVSYCLVIYYRRYYASYSGMVTVLTNRIGDVGLLLAIALMIVNGRWNICFLSINFLLVLIIILASITKRAQMPFSYWLPLAMAAPTPVSSLVHSSTLVTAGVYLVIRFNEFIRGGRISFILLFISVFTMFIAGALARVEYDLKKVIALSTLRQLGLIMIVLRLGAWKLGFFHLLTHAVFKSLLFLCTGWIIHSLKDIQDIRCYGGMNEVFPFVSMSLYVSILGLIGFPFLSGFYSKDLILEFVYVSNISLFLLFFILLSVSLTVLYSVRLCYYIYFADLKLNSRVNGGNRLNISISILILLGVRITVGSGLRWGFFFDRGVVIFLAGLKLLTLILIFIGGMLGLLGSLIMELYWFKSLFEFRSSIANVKEINGFVGDLICWVRDDLKILDVKWNEFFQVRGMRLIVGNLFEVFFIEIKIPIILGHIIIVSRILFWLA